MNLHNRLQPNTMALLLWATAGFAASADDWWDETWTERQQILISPQAGTGITGPIGPGATLLRLHLGNFNFSAGHPEGADLRIIGPGGAETRYHIEKYDSLFGEAFVWMATPLAEDAAPAELWLYYGAQSGVQSTAEFAGTYGEQALVVYHFGETTGSPKDSSGNNNHSATSAIPVEGSLIGNGARLHEASGIQIPASETVKWRQGAEFTWSLWIKPGEITGERTLMRYGAEGKLFRVGFAEGAPFLEIATGGTPQRVAGESPLSAGTWQHLAVVSGAGGVTLFLAGAQVARVDVPAPELTGPLILGKLESEEGTSFAGEIDEMQVWKVARPVTALLFEAQSQGASEQAAQLVAVKSPEAGGGHSETLAHLSLFGDIARNMMFDGWIAVGVCILMVFTGWTVAVQKFNYLNSIQQGSEAFMRLWHNVGNDLTVLEKKNERGEPLFGGDLSPKTRTRLKRSPLYHLYQIGTTEIQHRIGEDRSKGLSARSIQAIKASLDTGVVHENLRMNKGLVLLTISIAGGPYVGLLGTVVGVMITFALIAKSGEVDVNSIAPGIASALLATVAGLVVAIPALFIYSFLSSRIKELMASMQVFIDEFIAKMAEFYPTPAELGLSLAGTANGHDRAPASAAGASTAAAPVAAQTARGVAAMARPGGQH